MAEAPLRSGSEKSLRKAIAGWLLFIALETATQVAFKFGGSTLDDKLGVGPMIAAAAHNPVVWLGFGLYFLGFLVWLTILKDIDLGRAFPMTAVIYVATLAASVMLFHEVLNPKRVAGVLVIALGVALLAADVPDDDPAGRSPG